MSTNEEQTPFQLHRLGPVMEPDPDIPYEAWGVLNPASARAQDGTLYLFPRIVAEGNYSRIGIVRVNFDDRGNPIGVERLGYVLEPEETYERSERAMGGVEDPRVTYVEPLSCWIMAYTGVSAMGPRIALAASHDLFNWNRLGLLEFDPSCSVDFNQYGNKDGMLFPDVVVDPQGNPSLAIMHRPTYRMHHSDGTISLEVPCDVQDHRESIWIAYMSLHDAKNDIRSLTRVCDARLLATPVESWECLKIGGGTPPIRIREGWLTYYHGVDGSESFNPQVGKKVRYCGGALVLDACDPTKILYRSPHPVLEPETFQEQEGIVPNVVFPTAIDQRENGRLDVYYGMADSRIGVATSVLPEESRFEP
ncbi:MAG TPA: glycosidase [Chloroflexota bacterium]